MDRWIARALGLALVCSLPPASVFAADPPREVVERYVAATGGRAALDADTLLHRSGRMLDAGVQGRFEDWRRGGDHALRIVVSNLLRNALEAAAGQLVTISYRTDTVVQLVIRNPGRLSDELLAGEDLVASSKPEGLGIGIAIARHLSDAIGGTITYRNLDQLAETSITLPAAPSPMTTESDHAEDPARR